MIQVSTTMAILLSIAIGLTVTALLTVTISILKDKKVTEEEKQQLQSIIIETLNEAVNITDIKTELGLKEYCSKSILKKFEDNNIKGVSAKTVEVMLDLIINLNKEATKKLDVKA